MTTIDNIEDFLRIVREDEGMRSAVRRELLTEELLELPARVASMSKTQDSMLETQNSLLKDLADLRKTQDSILETQNSILETQNFLLKDLADLRKTQDSMLETQNSLLKDLADLRKTQSSMLETQRFLLKDLADLRKTQDSMLETQNSLLKDLADLRKTQDSMLETQNSLLKDLADLRKTQDSMLETQNFLLETQNAILERLGSVENDTKQNTVHIGDLKGLFMERAAREDAPIITSDMGLRWQKTLERSELGVIADEAQRIDLAVGISRDDMRRFRRADLVVEAVDSDGATCYIAVEVSYTADDRDTKRATRHAEYITRFTGVPAYAAIASVYIDNRIKNVLTEDIPQPLGVSHQTKVFWSRLPDLESPN